MIRSTLRMYGAQEFNVVWIAIKSPLDVIAAIVIAKTTPAEARASANPMTILSARRERLRQPRHFAGAGSGRSGARQRMACGWQATPILEQSGGPPVGSRAQMTQSSLQRAQFGWS
jgi:hypothetical protein